MEETHVARKRVAIVYGGRSAERDVSLMSARTVFSALDPRKYERLLVEISSDGRWSLGCAAELEGGYPALSYATSLPSIRDESGTQALCKGPASLGAAGIGADIVFPVLHGPYGEDGSIQGFARLAGLPCVGADILGSALCMDKQAAKRIMRDYGIPIAPFRSFRSPADAREAWPELERELGGQLFVKPANLGSSVGVSRVSDRKEYEAAVALAFDYDLKILVEKTMAGREIEVAVIGGRKLRASLPGEVVPRGSFYTYEAKYLDEEGADILAPAPLPASESDACRQLALRACEALCVSGMARVDMFLPDDGPPVANEVNTIPGFTSRSMFPLLWQASGLDLPRLVDELVGIAIESHRERGRLKSSPPRPIGKGA
jgi:D-alanine--D-alanine ligase